MAKIGLAAELAKQAAQAAREEMGEPAREGGAKKPAEPWKPAVLPSMFSLDQAVGTAVTRVAAYYRKALAHEGLDMAVVADTSQGAPVFQADLREGGTGKVVKAYTAPDLLGMFAAQQKVTGVVVDGQV
ncbi:MAG: hypothetical protein GC129_03080 [Proteobacteria bacterium]|nr:hypothetical protein [Pseudomonadota bacterium]